MQFKCNRKETCICEFQKCAGCQLSFYCSKACQISAWVTHKETCRQIREGPRKNINFLQSYLHALTIFFTIADHDLSPREVKSLAQLACHEARPVLDCYADKPNTFTDISIHVQYRDSFVRGSKGSKAKIELKGTNDPEARRETERKSIRCSVKVTYLWNKKHRTVNFTECI